MINSIFSSCNQILQGFKRQAYQTPDSITTFTARTIATAALAAIGSRCLSLFCNVGKNNYFIPISSVGAGAVAAALKLSPLKIAATTLGTYGGCKLANYLSPTHDLNLLPKHHDLNPLPTHNFNRPSNRDGSLVIKVEGHDLQNAQIFFENRNKKFVRGIVERGKIIHGFTFQKLSLNSDSIDQLRARSIFVQDSSLVIQRCKGEFVYPQSNDQTTHWTANFANPTLVDCSTPSFTQAEIQVAEHPALARFQSRCDNTPTLLTLRSNQIALFANVERHGVIDSSQIYGNAFKDANHQTLQNAVKNLNPPTLSNIFAFAAPIAGNAGESYSYEHLEALFVRAYLAFKSIKDNHGQDKQIVIHTGNWGTGASGNCAKTVALLQIAAACLAQVDCLMYYPMDCQAQFDGGYQLFNNLKQQNSKFTVKEFLTHLAANAARYSDLNLKF